MSTDLDILFSPCTVGGLELPNRFVMSPMTRRRALNGVPLPEVADYYRRRVEGGVGLIITEGVGISHPTAVGWTGVDSDEIPHLYGDEALAAWKRVVDTIHAAGGKVAPQLWHQGALRVAGTGPHPEAPSMRPSGIWGPPDGRVTVSAEYLEHVREPTRAMRHEEVEEVIAAYADTAANAVAIGFDAVAIHAAHGYLLDSFLWDRTNLRSDAWGGSIERRIEFPRRVIEAVRAVVGDLPIILRISQWKSQDYDARIASSPEELARVLAPLAEAGVDIFDVSARKFDVPAFEGSPRTLAGWVKQVTGRPTIAVGSIGLQQALFDRADGTADASDNVVSVARGIDEGEFDLAGVGRMLVAHPDWVRRVAAGDLSATYDRAVLKNYY